jgi:hypothetical protein
VVSAYAVDQNRHAERHAARTATVRGTLSP